MPLNSSAGASPPGFSPNIPRYFTSLEQAQNSLTFQRNRCTHAAFEYENILKDEASATTLVSETLLDEYEKNSILFRDTIVQWASAFQAYLDKNSANLDSTSLQGAALLKIQQLYTTLSIAAYKNCELTNEPS